MKPVVVIGAGFAGLSAAVRLADAGRRVVVLESAPRLGGRATSFADPETGERVDNGQHVLFGCYRETFAFLRTIGTAGQAPIDSTLSVTMVGDDGPRVLTCPRLPPPWHLAGGLLRWEAVSMRDRLNAWRVARALARKTPVRGTVAEWLHEHGQSDAICRWLWFPLALAALNQSPRVALADTFVTVLRQLFGGRARDAAIAVPAVPLDELYAVPARRFIEQRGGVVTTKVRARIATGADGRIAHVVAGDQSIDADAVISAVPWHAVDSLWAGRCPEPVATTCLNAASMGACPIVTVNLWLDAPTAVGGRPVGLVDRPMHWIFDKRQIFGGAATHIAMVASGAAAMTAVDNAHVVRMAFDDLCRAVPAAAQRRVVHAVVVRERRATFSLAAGEPPRPRTVTPLEGFYLAGDWIDTGLPSTIEGAVMSGHRAAAAVIGRARATA